MLSRVTSVAAIWIAVIVSSGCSQPKKIEEPKAKVVTIAPMSKPMRARPSKPLNAAQEAELATALAGAGARGSDSSGAGGQSSGAGGALPSDSAEVVAPSGATASVPARRSEADAAWNVDGESGAQGIVYPVAPEITGVSADMVNALQLADTDPRRRFVGVWDQISGAADSDFGHGGYRRTVLVFRTDGMLDIVRLYGEKAETRIDSRVVYDVSGDGTLSLSQDPKLSGVSRSTDLKLPGGRGKPPIIALAPRIKLPTRLSASFTNEDLTIEGKTYRKRKPEVK